MKLLDNFVAAFAKGMELADAKRPQAESQRTPRQYQPGLGPHTENNTVGLVLDEIQNNGLMDFVQERFVKYPSNPRTRCDLFIRSGTASLYIEVKMMRLLGDNGKTNDNIFMHILSPYPKQRSALTDIQKLQDSGFDGGKAIMIYGYDYDDYPLKMTIDAFTKLAGEKLLPGVSKASFKGLIHPHHKRGSVYGWLVSAGTS